MDILRLRSGAGWSVCIASVCSILESSGVAAVLTFGAAADGWTSSSCCPPVSVSLVYIDVAGNSGDKRGSLTSTTTASSNGSRSSFLGLAW